MYLLKTKQIFTFILVIFTVAFFSQSYAQENKKFTDAEIAHIVVTANQIDVDYGKLALQKTKNPEARKFAETMIRDHEDIIKQAAALAQKLGVIPKDNELSQNLLKQKEANINRFDKMDDQEFMSAYIHNEVDYHQAVIDAVKDILIPQTVNKELKETLVKVTPLLEHHLEMAKMSQQKIDGK